MILRSKSKGTTVVSLFKTLNELFAVLPKGAKGFYIGYSIITGTLGLFETAALALMLVVMNPIVSGVPLRLPIIGEVPTQWTPWLLIAICVLYVVKGIATITLHWFVTRRFARYELEVGNRLFRTYAQSSWEKRSQLSTADVTRIVDASMANANTGFIMPISLLPSSVVTAGSILIMLLVADPLVALAAAAYLGVVAFLIGVVLNRHMRTAGLHSRQFGYRVATIITEMVGALKEITLRRKLDEVGEFVNATRRRSTRARANISFLAQVPKNAMEIALVGGFIIVGGFAFLRGGSGQALMAIAIFGITGIRLVPALNSIQSVIATATANEVYAKDVIRWLRGADEIDTEESAEDTASVPANPMALELCDIGFKYPNSDVQVLDGINMKIAFGSTVAIVGPSGAGKSTLVDLMLGLSEPSKGTIMIDGIPLESVENQWRDRVGYVPQRVALFNGSVAQNVALTWGNEYSDEAVMAALERAELSELIHRGEGLQELIGENGSSISGGQQQRMGIARALYCDPLVMIMDEATSALDTATERRITAALERLHGRVTFVTVAHRLATVRDYDQICYLDEGRILGQGTFDEVVEQVPAFRAQARLAGLIED